MGLWWAILGGFLAPVLPGHGLPVLMAALVAAAPLLVFGRMRSRGIYPSAAIRLWVFRPFWYVQLSLPLIAAGGVIGFLAGAPFGAAMSTARWALLIAASAFAVAAVAGYIGSRRLQVKQLDACFSDLPEPLEGMRIVQVSDLHVGPHTSRSYLAAVARKVREARPDLIAITGDQVDDYAHDVAYFAEAFAGLSAPHGVFAIPGNHDVYAGWSAVRAGLEAMGITVLVNDAVEVRRGTGSFWLAGTGDPAGGGAAPDLGRTLARVPEGAFTIALAHNPALWPGLARRGVHLTLSGHTHYGQLSIPRLGWSLASPFLEYAMGTHRLAESLLYINPGTNYWGLPFRIGALPEVTVLTLRRTLPGNSALRTGSAGRSPAAGAVRFRREILYKTGTALYDSYRVVVELGSEAPKPPLYGVWNVEELRVDGKVRPPVVTDGTRWRRVFFSAPERFSIQLMSDSRERYNLVLDETKRTLGISKRSDPHWKTTLVYRRLKPDVLVMEGPFDGQEIQARLRRTEPPEFVLVTRGFHWINERPFNR